MKKIKNNKGIALVSLTIAIIILIVLTSMLIYNAKNGIKMRALKMMQNDIDLLSNEINSYYVKYGDIPAEIEYIGPINFEKQPNDDDEYYVIDLSAFDDITLNYGLDYNNITSSADTVNCTDVYIVNKQSMHVYYARGIEMDGIMYYTNDEDEEVKLSGGPVEKPETGGTLFSRQWGVIEIVFLSGTTYNATDTPNEPNMTSDMKAVYWENGVEKVEGVSSDFDKSKWYDYIAQTGATTSGGTSKWANAQTSDGSYWVWIPRYAYRIVYFDTEAHRDAYRADNTQTTGIVGYSDARGLVDKNGKTPSDLEEPVTSIGIGENLLRPHPAFEDGSETGYTQGEWDGRLEGIWIAKYEMSMEKSGVTTTTTSLEIGNVLTNNTIKAVSKSGRTSWRYIDIGNMYINGYNYARDKESHMLKNSEWGAMAYLTESKYGRNGTTVTMNTDSNYYTGGATGATPITNPLQSTTGNEYGIFDTVGGAWEYITGYVADASQNYGNSFASTNNTTNNKVESTKYSTVYKMSSSNQDIYNYTQNINTIFGDAIIETSTSGSGQTSWHLTDSYFIGLYNNNDYPFLRRGGDYNNTNGGIFCFGSLSDYYSTNSFRVCLAIE